MVAATRAASVVKRFYSGTFAPPTDFHSAASGSEVTAAEILAGGVRESDWSFPVLISTPNEDRQGDVLVAEGCDYAAFSRSPICFFDHEEIKFPIGSMRGPDGRLYFAVTPQGILGRIWIRQPQSDDPAAYAEACKTVWILVRDGLLNGISAGFDPLGPVKELSGGGSLYKRWELLEVSIVPVAANRDCRVLREPFAWDERVLKRFSPSVIKGLRSMPTSIAKEHKNTHDIKYRNGEWVILDNKTRKVLSHHKTRSEATAAMRALQFGKHEGKSKGLSEATGAGGGYVVPEDRKEMYKCLGERMKDHDARGHSLYFHPETGEVRHVFPENAGEDQVKAMAADLGDVSGVKGLTQTSEHPGEDDGFHRVYPHKDMEGGDMSETGHGARIAKRARRLARVGKAIYRLVRKRKVNGWVGKSLERLAQRVMPTLLQSEMPERKAIAVSWGIAAVHKGLLPLVVKAADADEDEDYDDDGKSSSADSSDDSAHDSATDSADDAAEDAADDAAADTALDVAGEPSEGPEGLELVQTAIENLEAALPRLEPERREFWANIIQQIRDHGEEVYPDEDFAGEDDAGAEAAAAGAGNDADEQQVSDEMLARYKGFRPRRIKRISIARKLKSMRRDPVAEEAIRKSANHLHEIGDMPLEQDEHGCHLKGYTPAHHRQARLRARELDRLHGALTKGEEPRGEEEPSKRDDGLNFDELMPHLKSLDSRVGALTKAADAATYQATGRRTS